MHPFLVLLHLFAAVMLLLWAVRMVRTGVERAFGGGLRRWMRWASSTRAGMALCGTALALVLQSGTAVAILATGFAGSGLITVASGIAAVLGADVGSALGVKVLSYDLSELIPLLLLVGATLFLKFERPQIRQIGRITLGVAFILMSLRMVGEATEPMRGSAVLGQLMTYLAGDLLTSFAVAALVAWALHSSVATVLLLASLSAKGMLPVEAAVAMVLGANLGSGLLGVWLMRGAEYPGRHIPLGCLLLRGGAAVAGLLGLMAVPMPVQLLGATPAAQVVNAHVLFNVGILVLALPFVGWAQRLTAAIWNPGAAEPGFDSALDRQVFDRPKLALACAQRELLRIGETVEAMLRPTLDLIDTPDPTGIAQVRRLDQLVARRQSELKLYIAELNRAGTSAAEAIQGVELAGLAADFRTIGTIICKTLLRQAEEKAREGLEFSHEGWTEISEVHTRVLANMQLSLCVLMGGNLQDSRELVAGKAVLRQLEEQSRNRHHARLQAGFEASIATSDLHLEIVRALKEINSLLVRVAYPILASSSQLLDTRLRTISTADAVI